MNGGLDCYGILREFYSNELGIVLPKYETIVGDGKKLMGSALSLDSISDSFHKVDSPKEYDVILFKIGNIPLHLAIYLDNKNMLHSFWGSDSCVERWNNDKWERRLVGFYRHKEAF